jgi:hypothetical protein
MRAIARQWSKLQSIFREPQVCARGYVDREQLMHTLERARHGVEPYSFALIQTISLELWLRSLERPRSTSMNIPMIERPLVGLAEWESTTTGAQVQ